MDYIGLIDKTTKEELLRIAEDRIYTIRTDMERLCADPGMYEMPSDLPVYIAESEFEIETLEIIIKFLRAISS